MSNTANAYLRTKVLTASPAELRLMLIDGAIKFSRQAAEGLTNRDYESVFHGLSRAKKIVLELSTSLNHQADPDLCERMASLYNFIYRRLVDANLERSPDIIQECIKLLEYERETWVMFMEQLNSQQPSQAAEQAPPPATAPTPIPAPAARPRPALKPRLMPSFAGAAPATSSLSIQG